MGTAFRTAAAAAAGVFVRMSEHQRFAAVGVQRRNFSVGDGGQRAQCQDRYWDGEGASEHMPTIAVVAVLLRRAVTAMASP
jgi:hypothetical protein